MKDPMNVVTAYAMVIIVIVVAAVLVLKEKGFRPNESKDSSHPMHESLVRENQER
jgi:hypothetical protein